MTEGLFDDDARALGGARADELLDDGAEERGWNGEVVCGVLGRAELAADGVEGGVLGVVAIDVAQKSGELFPGVGVEAAVGFDAAARALLELVQCPAGLGDTHHRHVEGATLHHGLQRGKDLLVREISGSAEEYQCVRRLLRHEAS